MKNGNTSMEKRLSKINSLIITRKHLNIIENNNYLVMLKSVLDLKLLEDEIIFDFRIK